MQMRLRLLMIACSFMLVSGTPDATARSAGDSTVGSYSGVPGLFREEASLPVRGLSELLLPASASVRALRDRVGQVMRSSERLAPLAALVGFRDYREIYQHMDALFPVSRVSRGEGSVSALAFAPADLDQLRFDDGSGHLIDLVQWQEATSTDGLVVLHRGQVVYERYDHGMDASRKHSLWSVSKSFTGVIASDLVEAGVIDPDATIGHYLPELNDSAWADATVQQTLDMTTAVDYTESLDPRIGAGSVDYLVAAGMIPVGSQYPGPRRMIDFLKARKKNGQHGSVFNYKTVDTEVIGLLISRVTGKDLPELLSGRLWGPLGAAHDGYFLVDGGGLAMAGSGLNATAHDLARFGEMLRLEGRFNGNQVLQPGTVSRLRQGGSREAFSAGSSAGRTGYSYHDFWWVDHENGASLEAKGANGQHIHVNPDAETVIVKLSSSVFQDKLLLSTHVVDRNAFSAISKALQGR